MSLSTGSAKNSAKNSVAAESANINTVLSKSKFDDFEKA